MSPNDDEAKGTIPIRHRLAGWGLRAALGTLRRLPAVFSYAVADLLAIPLLVGSWWRERRVGRGVDRNLRIVYRQRVTRNAARRLRWAWARHMTRMAVDFARMPDLRASNLEERVDIADLERLRREVGAERGVICITGHIGVAELTGHVAALSGMPVTGVFRPSKNRALDQVLTGIRSSGGQKVLSKWVSVWPLKKTLDRGEVVGLAVDENAEHKPVFVPFLGTVAATTAMPAMLQLATGLPMVVISVHRIGRCRYRFHLWDVIRYQATGDREADVAAILTRMNDALSRSILAYPEQWFWGMRRYRNRPDGEVLGTDGLPPTADGSAARVAVGTTPPRACEA